MRWCVAGMLTFVRSAVVKWKIDVSIGNTSSITIDETVVVLPQMKMLVVLFERLLVGSVAKVSQLSCVLSRWVYADASKQQMFGASTGRTGRAGTSTLRCARDRMDPHHPLAYEQAGQCVLLRLDVLADCGRSSQDVGDIVFSSTLPVLPVDELPVDGVVCISCVRAVSSRTTHLRFSELCGTTPFAFRTKRSPRHLDAGFMLDSCQLWRLEMEPDSFTSSSLSSHPRRLPWHVSIMVHNN